MFTYGKRISTLKSADWRAGKKNFSRLRQRQLASKGQVQRFLQSELEYLPTEGILTLTGLGSSAQAKTDTSQSRDYSDTLPQRSIEEFLELTRSLLSGKNNL